jgi:hypothetical protein
MSKFRTGADAAKDAAASKSGASFAKTHYFSLSDGEEIVVRFLTDADSWITVDQHTFVPTKKQPSDYEGNWPRGMGAVCRRTKLADNSTLYRDCFICDHVTKQDGSPFKPSSRTWATAVIREEVRDDNGVVVGFADQTREVVDVRDGKPTGERRTEKATVIVNMGYRNFFGALQGFAGRYGTVLDRDYYIRREGDGLQTVYHIIPADPIDVSDPDNASSTVRFDLRDRRFMSRYEADVPDLEGIVMDKASDGFYERFFITGDSASSVATPVSNDVEDAKVVELAARIKGYSTTPV